MVLDFWSTCFNATFIIYYKIFYASLYIYHDKRLCYKLKINYLSKQALKVSDNNWDTQNIYMENVTLVTKL